MTDGILLNEIQHDRCLLQYDTLIIDEAHAQLNIDFIWVISSSFCPNAPI